LPDSELGMVVPLQFIAWLAKYMTVWINPFFIARVRAIGAPMSSDSSVANSSKLFSSTSHTRSMSA
jgi:hypothetical protein